jgi:tetratricopeptide (TPR) repeat protein
MTVSSDVATGALEPPTPARSGIRARLLAGPDPWNRVVAALVGIFTLIIYGITLSPDVSFWDSGEFIATSYSLGIPHPPGTPLYVLMGRVFSLLFHSLLGIASAAQAVNLLSAIPSALAAVFLHLCVVRVGKKIWNQGDQASTCYPALVAGATAALFAAFASTLWINSIEAEVYAVSGMWTVFTAWIILLWADSEPKDERLLVVIAYLLALNIGVHLATYLAALAILPFAFLYEKRLAIPISFGLVLCMAKDMQFFLLVVTLLLPATLQLALLPSAYKRRHRGVLLSAQGVAIVLALWAALGLESSVFQKVLLFGAPLAAFLLPVYGLPAPGKLENPFRDLGFLLAFVTALGVTCHLYLPIRSALDPAINEAQPDNWRAFWDVILRAQYRPTSIFNRQAGWVYQFDHMFWRYFREQWPSVLPLLGIPGLLVHLRRERRTFVLFGLLFFWASAMLVVKMNFTDHEVRERDYFFAAGFFWFATWMGLGLGWLAELVRVGAPPNWRRPFSVLTAALCLAIALIPLRHHWETHDRRGDWIAYDYARNMLVALEKDAIIFTNGDNDTFPLWYLQEVHGFRKDVRVVNLSLLNTPWYSEQLRNEEPRVPMSYTTEELWKLHPVQDRQSGKIYLVKDQVGMNIVNTVYASDQPRPVYFAVTVDDLLGLEEYLELEGLVFRFVARDSTAAEEEEAEEEASGGDLARKHTVPQRGRDVNLERTRRNLEEIYHYRGLLDANGKLDRNVYRDPNEQKLITNYAAAWARMALRYREEGNYDAVLECMYKALNVAPDYDPISSSLGGLLVEAGRFDEALDFYRERYERIRRGDVPEDLRVYMGLAYLARRADNQEEALHWYLEGYRVDPTSPDMIRGLYTSYLELGRYREAENVLQQWIRLHPGDESAKDVLGDLRRVMQESGSAESGAADSG